MNYKHFEKSADLLNSIRDEKVLFLLGGDLKSNKEWEYIISDFKVRPKEWGYATGLTTYPKHYDVVIISPNYKFIKDIELPEDYFQI